MKHLRILLFDHQPEMITLLQRILEPEHCVIGSAENDLELVEPAHTLRPDIVLTDIDMPGSSGLDATRVLRRHLPECRVIVHSSHDEPEIMAAAFAAGASGYLIKGSPQDLITSIRTVICHVWDNTEEFVVTQPHSGG